MDSMAKYIIYLGCKGGQKANTICGILLHCSSLVVLQENSDHWSTEGIHQACPTPIIIPQYTGDAAERLTPVPMMNEAEPETYEHHQSDSLSLAQSTQCQGIVTRLTSTNQTLQCLFFQLLILNWLTTCGFVPFA